MVLSLPVRRLPLLCSFFFAAIALWIAVSPVSAGLKAAGECIAALRGSPICTRPGTLHAVSYVRYEKTGSSTVHGSIRMVQRWLAQYCGPHACFPFMPVRSGDHTGVDVLTEDGPQGIVSTGYFDSSEVKGACGVGQVVAGGVNANGVTPSVLLVTVLRRPRDKFWSAFFYFSGGKQLNKDAQFDLDAVAKKVLALRWNDIPVRLASRYVRSLGRVMPTRDTSVVVQGNNYDLTMGGKLGFKSITWFAAMNATARERAADRACATLRGNFDVVGLMHDLPRFFGRMALLLEVPPCAWQNFRSNDLATPYTLTRVDELPAAVHARVQSFIAYDARVYECAMKTSADQVARLNTEDAATLDAFVADWDSKNEYVT
jgi:hypothetical protein